ncbi:hypothetical protein KUW19_00730 [Ferrimonas balearica]|uniref:hypothetical protein n=1 Tax=Ferrimonas balearica TaxID=44012 RepID=UPI001C954AB6|nr:hypothetical protein [Ferrimonas balearica]MBY6105001.1 hypothetical protein [Ferrimonas balearica]
MTLEDALEEAGLTESEWVVLGAIIARPGFPCGDVSKFAKLSKHDYRKCLPALLDLGYIAAKAAKGGDNYVPTNRGTDVNRTLKNARHGIVEEVEEAPAMTEAEANALTVSLQICNHIETIRELCGATPEWMQIIAVLYGMNEPMTPGEIFGHINSDLLDLEVLELKIAKRSDPALAKKLPAEQRWLERVSEEPLTVCLSDAGREAAALMVQDILSR